MHSRTSDRLILTILLTTVVACSSNGPSPSDDDPRPSQTASETSGSGGRHRPALIRGASGIQTLVRSLGSPWSGEVVSVDEHWLRNSMLKRTKYFQQGVLLTIETDQTGRASSFELQSGSEGACGHVAHLEPGVELLASGLGLPPLRVEQRNVLRTAWDSGTADQVKVAGAIISADSDNCRYRLRFLAV